jgi:hypothetical protein
VVFTNAANQIATVMTTAEIAVETIFDRRNDVCILPFIDNRPELDATALIYRSPELLRDILIAKGTLSEVELLTHDDLFG